MPTAEKAVKEKDHNACGKERKTKPQMLVANEKSVAALIMQANSWHQITNERNKRAETTSKTQTVAYMQA